MRPAVGTCVIGILFGSAAFAGDCGALARFATVGEVPVLQASEPSCSRSRLLGGAASEDCFWAFPFRSEAAKGSFRQLATDLQACATEPTRTETATVNHPDSFDQITGRVSGVTLSLSLKDKGALGQTLVVLRRKLP